MLQKKKIKIKELGDKKKGLFFDMKSCFWLLLMFFFLNIFFITVVVNIYI